MNGVVTVV